MNIGIFTDAYYPQINGVVISTQILKNELTKLGHNVTIITVSDPRVNEEKLDVLRLPSIPFAVLPNFRVGSFYSRRIMKEIKRLNLDIIHTQTEFSLGIFARIVSKYLSIPLVHTYHTMYEEYTHYFSTKIIDKYAKTFAKKMSKIICNSVDSIIVPTAKVKTALIDYGIKNKVNIVPTGVDLKPFSKYLYSENEINKAKLELGLNKEDKVILFVGRIAKEKSVDIIINNMPEVIKHDPQIKLLIIGGGPETEHLKALSRKINCSNSIIFAGEKPWCEIGKYYQIGDVFVSASTSETQGLTYIEAMAAELPVIAMYDTNLDEVIIDGVNARFFYEEGELGNIILDLLNNDLLTKYLTKNAYDCIAPLSSEQFGKSIESIYYNTLSNKVIFNFDKLSLKLS